MSRLTQTPGPWMLKDDTVVALETPNDGGDIVCISPDGFEDSMTRWRANAQLISAAPEMYDAIDPEMLEAIAKEIDSFEHSARAESLRVIARKQRAAIKKAKGETA